MMCKQVVRMVNGLLGDDGNPLLRVQAVCGTQVFDEPDMLLCGSFQNQITCLINMLCFDEKQVSPLATSKVGIPMEIDAEIEDGSISEEEEEQEEVEYLDDTAQISTIENETVPEPGSDIKKGWS